MIIQVHLHFPDTWGRQVFMDWLRESTHAATILPLRALQVSYATARRRSKPVTVPRTLRLSALTAAVCCP